MISSRWRLAVTVGVGLFVALLGCLSVTPVSKAASPAGHTAPSGQQGLLAQLVLTPTKDNTLYESTTGTISNGAGDYLFAGQTNRAGAIRRGVLAFDLAGKLPSGATIVSATLQLHLSKTSAGTTPVNLHRVLANWGEGASNANSNEGGGATATTGDATWLHTSFNTTFWQTPGGDFTPAASATTAVAGEAIYQWRSPTLLADVQSWLADPASNFGWIIIGDENASGTAKRFDSKENPTAANRPQLTIVYTVTETTAARVYLPLITK